MERELDYVALGMRIRQARKENHVTQEQLGEICELSTAHIGHIERGTRIPSLDTLFRISQALHVSMDYLYLERQNDLQKSMRLGIQKICRFSTMVQEDWLELCCQLSHYMCHNTHSCLHRTNVCHYQLKLRKQYE